MEQWETTISRDVLYHLLMCEHQIQTHQSATQETLLHSVASGQKFHRVSLNVVRVAWTEQADSLLKNNYINITKNKADMMSIVTDWYNSNKSL